MKLHLTIACENAAFEPDPANEAGRILENFARRLRGMLLEQADGETLRDYNGNTVGSVRVQLSKYEDRDE